MLGWSPTYTFLDLVKEMVRSDLEAITNQAGHFTSAYR